MLFYTFYFYVGGIFLESLCGGTVKPSRVNFLVLPKGKKPVMF